MSNNHQQLTALLDFIDKLSKEPGNEWFVEELQKRYGKETAPIAVSDSPKIDKIEHYLALDYELDKAEPSIDYSFISDLSVRDRLDCDYREMMRYRYGVRSHQIDFDEYCRYANMQIEMLINFFYLTKYETLSKIKEHLMMYQDLDNFRTSISNAKTFGNISLMVKTFAFTNEFNLKSLSFQLAHLRDVRNHMSHRGGSAGIDCAAYRKQLIAEGYNLNSYGEIYLSTKLKENTMLYAKNYNKKNEETYKAYEQELWCQRKPFDEVLEMIKIIAETVCEKC